jgi:hypothetical protein
MTDKFTEKASDYKDIDEMDPCKESEKGTILKTESLKIGEDDL